MAKVHKKYQSITESQALFTYDHYNLGEKRIYIFFQCWNSVNLGRTLYLAQR